MNRIPICPKCKIPTIQGEYDKKLGYSECIECGGKY